MINIVPCTNFMSKDDDKVFHTIGEVSKSVDVAQHVLRFWEEKFSQIKPIKRKGRRLYNKNDIELIKRIKHLLYDRGYTMKGVQREMQESEYQLNNSAECNTEKKLQINNNELHDIYDELLLIENYLEKITCKV